MKPVFLVSFRNQISNISNPSSLPIQDNGWNEKQDEEGEAQQAFSRTEEVQQAQG